MYTLQTDLTHFRFLKEEPKHEHFRVEWYKLEENEDNSESYGVCLSEHDLQALLHYVETNSINFHNPKKFDCDNENSSIPRCGTADLKPIDSDVPKNLVLKKKPLLTHKEDTIFPCMDIELLDEDGGLSHRLELPFNLIGKIVWI